jgi:hypothetical protein
MGVFVVGWAVGGAVISEYRAGELECVRSESAMRALVSEGVTRVLGSDSYSPRLNFGILVNLTVVMLESCGMLLNCKTGARVRYAELQVRQAARDGLLLVVVLVLEN